MCEDCKLGWDIEVTCPQCGYRFDIAITSVDHEFGNLCSSCLENAVKAAIGIDD